MARFRRWWRLMTTDTRKLSEEDTMDKAVLIMATSIGFTLFIVLWGVFFLLPIAIAKLM